MVFNRLAAVTSLLPVVAIATLLPTISKPLTFGSRSSIPDCHGLSFDCYQMSKNLTHRPPNVPQRHANQAMHARYAAHARTFFLSDFVSVENKGSKIQLPKLKVASSSLVARSRFPRQFLILIFKLNKILRTVPRNVPQNLRS